MKMHKSGVNLRHTLSTQRQLGNCQIQKVTHARKLIPQSDHLSIRMSSVAESTSRGRSCLARLEPEMSVIWAKLRSTLTRNGRPVHLYRSRDRELMSSTEACRFDHPLVNQSIPCCCTPQNLGELGSQSHQRRFNLHAIRLDLDGNFEAG